MAKADFGSVDEYIAAQPAATQGALRRVRSAIRKALPEAEERISYKMPSYKLQGGGVLHFAGWKRHYALYLASDGVLGAFKDELARYDVKKGTVSFPFSEPVPAKLIERIARFHATEPAARRKSAAVKTSK